MKIKILFFILSFVLNAYCMKRSKEDEIVAGILAEMNEVNEYYVVCAHCSEKFTGKGKAQLASRFLRHFYSHNRELHEIFYTNVKGKAYTDGELWNIECPECKNSLEAKTIFQLSTILMNHIHATKLHNPDTYNKVMRSIKGGS